MTEVQNERLDRIIDGLECLKGVAAKVRGAPTPIQIERLIAAARNSLGTDEAVALIVPHGCASRAKDLREL